ncbi:mechanosensitive ion channel domain-containing protein [Marivirga sp.]|uniref:mechanosensitive ion channel domain-containing protein n=1 Tax=Marivirga sp. TaxID=2018662 RepID=UPI002D80354F|nr:mechanosensitive ion channel domain-containing protein [Marivirga sp.]HET8861491.1 mechanosensitive ion channel domain-containing protein [Marivirga sp.]
MLKIICFFITFLMISTLAAHDKSIVQNEAENLEVSGAELIIRFQKLISEDHQRLIQMKSRSKQLEQEVIHLTNEFERLDAELKENLDSKDFSDQNEKLEQVLSSLDFHLRSGQAILQQISIVETKIEKQEELVEYITTGQVPISEDSVIKLLSIADTAVQSGANSETQNRKELAALQDLRVHKAELTHARNNLFLVDQLIRKHKEDIELTILLTKATTGLKELLEKQPQSATVKRHLKEVFRRYAQDTVVLNSLKIRIQTLEAYRPPVVEAVGDAEERVDSAKSELEFLQSSIAPHRVVYWLKTHLPSMAIIILAFFVIWILSRWSSKLILNKFIKSRKNAESADRLETLKLASGSIITILVVLIGFLVLLSQIGVDLTVVLGGAAVLSLVIALGAQSLVKDYLSGFIILLENQYRAGNVVKINSTTGVVENMSLRLTVLRDLEGITHFIPHGQITDVSNLTHHWSRVMLEIGVSYNENVDKVMMVLQELGNEMKTDEVYGSLIIGDMEMLGVDKFCESAVVIKFLIKTWPLKQWIVKRELLRRIKNRFDELGIEIPFPHLTVYHRQSENQLESKHYSPEAV